MRQSVTAVSLQQLNCFYILREFTIFCCVKEIHICTGTFSLGRALCPWFRTAQCLSFNV